MNLTRKDIELMAPAGSFESLVAASRAKADSVYFGLGKMNMRSRSSVNFTTDDLARIVEFCREKNMKTYLTMNIVFYDQDIGEMKELVDIAREQKVDAIIASDMAVIQYARSRGVEVHISTQSNVSNTGAVDFYSRFADVMVLARELNLGQVRKIYDHIQNNNVTGPSGKKIRLELFSHGALCMSISGKCYLSLHNHNYSANRGACLQDCRRGYIVTDKESGNELEIDNEYILSPKDLSTIHFLNKIFDSGIRVLKIEGRARPPEYVKVVTECYNEAILAYLNGDYTAGRIEEWQKRLSTVFNRGFWDGYYLGQKLGEWSHVYGSKATKKKIYVAKGMNYFSRLNVAEFLCETGSLKVGDEILVTGPTTGVIHTRVKEIRVNLQNVEQVNKGELFSIPLEQTVRRSDKLFKWEDVI